MTTMRSLSPLLLLVSSAIDAFYLPGVAPREYKDGDKVEIRVHKLSSARTHLPYDYYSLPFCKPDTIVKQAENLGEVLHGAVIQNSPYDIFMGKSEFRIACRRELTKAQKVSLSQRIRQDYRVHMIMDNLPAATKMIAEMPDGTKKDMYDRGFRLGFIGSKDIPGTDPNKPYVNNHLRFIVKYHKSDTFSGARIVGFEVEAYSVKHSYEGAWNAAAPKLTSVPLRPDLAPMPAWSPEIVYTYDVVWESSDIAWASRWDLYLYMGDDQVHWFSILNSLVIVLLLSGIVAMIMVRTLRRDLQEYNSIEEKEELLEESGWKLVHADVLRTPPNATLLAVSVGTGMQLLCMTLISIVCAMLGFLSPANRGSMMTVTILLFVLMGCVAGYCSAVTYKSFKGNQWKALTLLTAFLYPGITFGIFFTLNFFIWGQASSGAVPFGTMFALLCIWFLISFPLVWVGVWLGYRRPLADPPVKTNMVPRVIPSQAWYLHLLFTMVIGGILPFGAVFIELYFIMTSVWLQRFYYVFGFLALVLLILIITCAEMAIVLCYFQLCNENYMWQWRSFLNTGCAGVFLFGYSFVYFSSSLEIMGVVSTMLYFSYMFITSMLFALVTGTVGCLSSWWFVLQIYSAVKVD
uniref:Transmembrane 9 superfamily member n=1 Tax=Chrysotila carterae TaxID=13221 RepID=A0A7S4BHJ0_CHRCT